MAALIISQLSSPRIEMGGEDIAAKGYFLGGRYEILEHIGSGGMADVYKARCHKLNRYVAIKVLRREYCDNESFVRKFTVEAQSTAGLTHPNIVNIYDAGNEEVYIIS